MDRKLIDYLPPILRRVFDLIAITDAQQPMIEEAWDALQKVMDDQFLATATEDGVTVWEKELNISPLSTDTLETRKDRIKSLWIYGILYTYRWLQNWLKNAVGEKNPAPIVDGYNLNVKLPIKSDYMRLLDALRRYIPANMVLNETITLTEQEKTIYLGVAFRRSVIQIFNGALWDISGIVFLTDEDGLILKDGAGYILFEEAMTV